MKQSEYTELFSYLGEILRDITAIEFLMKIAIAKYANDIINFPKPPYIKGSIYNSYPDSFGSKYSFGTIVGKFNEKFPTIRIPQELIDLRNAIAHGMISEIGTNEIPQLVKFREVKTDIENKKELKVEFSMDLDLPRLRQIRQSLSELRRIINQIAGN